MFKTLLKSRFSALFASLTQGSKKNKKKKSKAAPILLGVLFGFLILYFAFAMSIMFYGVCLMAKEFNQGWIVFSVGTMASSALCLFGSIFATKTQIFESKDNELLLSMPIPPKYIFLSRMVVLLLVNYLLEAIIMLPCMIMYGVVIGYTPLGFIFSLLVFLLVPLLTLAISSVIAWVVSEIASRMKSKTLVTVVLFLLAFGGYMYLCFGLGFFAGSGEIENVDFTGLKNTMVFWWPADAIANGNVVSMLLFALCAIVPAAITFVILDKSFIRIVTTKKTASKIKYKGNKEKSSSAYFSLAKKELRRFFSSSAYIMNAGLGNVMILVVAIIVAINSGSMMSLLNAPELDSVSDVIKGFLPTAVACIIVFLSSTNIISAPSISLENKSLWILQTAPVDPRDVLMAKLTCHLIICMPFTVVSTLIVCIAFKVEVIATILTTLVGMSAVCFTAYWGLFLGLKFPKFDWQNENVAVKQGFAVFGTMFGMMLASIIVGGLGILCTFLNTYFGLFVMILPFVIGCIGIHMYLINGGAKAFENLRK